MSTVSITTNCPECDADIVDIEGSVAFSSQYHPYGSTTAREELVEVEDTPEEIVCDECGYAFTDAEIETVVERLIEVAQDARYD